MLYIIVGSVVMAVSLMATVYSIKHIAKVRKRKEERTQEDAGRVMEAQGNVPARRATTHIDRQAA